MVAVLPYTNSFTQELGVATKYNNNMKMKINTGTYISASDKLFGSSKLEFVMFMDVKK